MSIMKVAKLAGCSHATVSRVINRQPGVSEDTTVKVQTAMRKLGYTPPTRRRGPQPKGRRHMRTGTVVVLMFRTDPSPVVSPVSTIAIHAAEEALGDLGYTLAIGQVKDATRIPGIVARGEFDGLILHGEPPDHRLADRLKNHPCVWIMSPRSDRGYWGDRVAPDHEAIGRTAAQYLLGRGHRKLGFLYVEQSHLGYEARAREFCKTAEDAGAVAQVLGKQDTADNKECDPLAVRENINACIDQLLSLPDMPTGLFVPKGQATLAVYEALRRRNIQPGADVTVVACDNDPMLTALDPMVATIDVRADRIGRMAVEQLMRRIEQPELNARSLILVEPSLIIPPNP